MEQGSVTSVAEPFERCFLTWVAANTVQTAGQAVTLDGKRVRRSHQRTAGQSPLHLVGAWATEQRRRKVAVDGKFNESTALPVLIRARAGCIVTIDAMGYQRNVAHPIREQGADDVLALKGNQTTLHQEVADLLPPPRPHCWPV